MIFCGVDGCDKHYGPAYAGGKRVCVAHFNRWRRYHDFYAHIPVGQKGHALGAKTFPAAPLAPLIRRYRESHAPDTYTNGTPAWHKTLDELPYSEVAKLCGVSVSTLQGIVAGRQAHVTEEVADRICIKLGSHPMMVYGDDWLVQQSVSQVAS